MLSNRINEVKNDVKNAANEARAYPEVSDIKRDASMLRDDASSLAARVKEDGSALASKISHQISDTASEAYETIKAESRRQADRVEAKVHADPLKAVMVAAGVGFVLGFLTRR